MSELCTIKANSHGIQLLLDEACDFETLIKDICTQFARGRDFFGKAEIILEVTGRKLDMEELRVVVQAIELNSDVRVKLLSDTDPDSGKRALFDIEDYFSRSKKEKLRVLPDSVASGAALAFDESVVIMGDVKSGASVAAAGNVIIMGNMCGAVVAGGTTDRECFVAVAGEVESTDVIIGGVSGDIELPEEETVFGFFKKKKKTHDVTCFAVFNNQLVMEPMKEGIIGEILG